MSGMSNLSHEKSNDSNSNPSQLNVQSRNIHPSHHVTKSVDHFPLGNHFDSKNKLPTQHHAYPFITLS